MGYMRIKGGFQHEWDPKSYDCKIISIFNYIWFIKIELTKREMYFYGEIYPEQSIEYIKLILKKEKRINILNQIIKEAKQKRI